MLLTIVLKLCHICFVLLGIDQNRGKLRALGDGNRPAAFCDCLGEATQHCPSFYQADHFLDVHASSCTVNCTFKTILRQSSHTALRGISHIYAKNQDDLFCVQGYNAARARLFQLEVWRRGGTGTIAEIQGPKALDRDIGARLLQPRVDLRQDMNYYHPQGEQIIAAFVKGIKTYIKQTEHSPELLPVEFRLLGITPQAWTPEIVVSRLGGIFLNLQTEVPADGLYCPQRTDERPPFFDALLDATDGYAQQLKG